MLLLKTFANFRLGLLKRCVITEENKYVLYRKLSCLRKVKEVRYGCFMLHDKCRRHGNTPLFSYKRIFCTKQLWENHHKELSSQKDNEISKITQLFPHPRATLNEFAARRSEKTFDVYFKQQTVAPKSGHKKSIVSQKNAWTCIYAFMWPENQKFESTAISKKQAAEKAATQAIEWLHHLKHIDRHGKPIYDTEALHNIQKTLNDPIHVNVSEQCVQRINSVWRLYEDEIRDIYKETHECALLEQPMLLPSASLDSTLDDEGELPDGDVSMDDTYELEAGVNRRVHPVYGRVLSPPSPASLQRRDRKLRSVLAASSQDLTPLPIDEYTSCINTALESSRVCVVVGAAGCGKSTRAPRAVLAGRGAGGAVLVAEPRRVAAVGLARRVADELGERVGETVGYQVRLQAEIPSPPGGSILYCTSGILLRRLQANPGLHGCTHVFIDEAHERDINTDVSLLLLKKAMDLNPELRVVIMSATLDIQVFTKYFGMCPVVEVPGRTFPVQVTYLEELKERFRGIQVSQTLKKCTNEKPYVDCAEIVNVIRAVDANEPEGAILVFLPGWAEIGGVKSLLEQQLGASGRHMILPIHSRLSTSDQTKIFNEPMGGVRKIVLATNIAETSITIPDVVYVVDGGAHREARPRPGTGISSLECVWVSRAAAAQRAGRAGRVRAGHCFKLYTREKEAEFVPHNTPEILRVPLEQTVLNCKSYSPGESAEQFLSQLPTPPADRAVKAAVQDLLAIGALWRHNEAVTPLGRLLNGLAVHPRLGCMLVHSAILGNMVCMADVVSQLATSVEVFHNAADRKDEIREIKRQFDPRSDHVALHMIQQRFEQNHRDNTRSSYCERYGLRVDRLLYCKAISDMYLTQLINSRVVDVPEDLGDLDLYSGVGELCKAMLLSGSDRVLTTRRHLKTRGKMAVAKELMSGNDRAHIGSESVNHSVNKNKSGARVDLLTYFGGFHSTERRALVLHKTSLVTPHTVLLYSRADIVKEDIKENADEVVLSLPKHQLKIFVSSSHADIIFKAREMLWGTLQYYTERHNKNVDFNEKTNVNEFRLNLLEALNKFLNEAEKETFRDS